MADSKDFTAGIDSNAKKFAGLFSSRGALQPRSRLRPKIRCRRSQKCCSGPQSR